MLITIGAFDGFHKGHEELFRICRENADGNEWAVVTFWPHPSEYMHRIEHSLFTLKERELLRRVLNIPNMYVLCFDDALMNLSPVDFWHLLRAKIHVSGLVIETFSNSYLMYFACSGNHEVWQITIVIESKMKLNSAFGLRIICPWEDVKTQLNGCRIHQNQAVHPGQFEL